MLAVLGYCLARSFVPALHPCGRHRDLDVWHGAMAAAMATMLLAPQGRLFSAAALGVCLAGVGWSLRRVAGNVARAESLRITVGMLAMTAMLVPSLLAPAASAASAGAHWGHGMHGTHGGPVGGAAPSGAAVPLPVLLTGLLVTGLLLLLLVRLRETVRGSIPVRLDAGCDVAMAAAMGYMLLVVA